MIMLIGRRGRGRGRYITKTPTTIIAWNVRGLQYPNKRGDVKRVLRRYCCDAAILIEYRLEEVNQHIALSTSLPQLAGLSSNKT